jgi:hypothetical protein
VLVVVDPTNDYPTHEGVLLVIGLVVLLVALVTDLLANTVHHVRTSWKRCPMRAEHIQAAALVRRHRGHRLGGDS